MSWANPVLRCREADLVSEALGRELSAVVGTASSLGSLCPCAATLSACDTPVVHSRQNSSSYHCSLKPDRGWNMHRNHTYVQRLT